MLFRSDRARNLPVRPAVGVGDVLNTVARGQFPLTRPFLTGAAETLVLGFGLAAALALLTDGRYRDFPSAVYLTPALAFAVLRVTQAQAAADADKPAQLLAFALAGTAVATVINEGLGNTQAVMWGATALFLSITWAIDGTRDAYQRWRARVANPKTSPTEAGPAL